MLPLKFNMALVEWMVKKNPADWEVFHCNNNKNSNDNDNDNDNDNNGYGYGNGNGNDNNNNVS